MGIDVRTRWNMARSRGTTQQPRSHLFFANPGKGNRHIEEIDGLERGGETTREGPFDGKMKRLATSLVLRVDPNRDGECKRCGACCMFLVRCPFLKFEDGKPNSASCKAYMIRPLQCRKYPRTKKEQIHQPCGYFFKDSFD
jgi:hypothetical protein